MSCCVGWSERHVRVGVTRFGGEDYGEQWSGVEGQRKIEE
jgi:hypothetical protein